MTTKERANYALQMARRRIDAGEGWNDALRFVEDAINGAVEDEREACAKLADELSGERSLGEDIGEAIRARRNTYATENTSTHQKCG